MAAVEIPWSRIVTWSPSSERFGLTPSGVLTLNRVLPGVLTTDTAVPAGSASIRVAELPGGGELGRYGYALRTFGGALLVPTNLDGATLNAGYAYPRHNPAVWTPEWNTPGGDIVLETRLWSNALGLHAAKLSGLIVGPSTVGDLQYWDSLDLATTVAPGHVVPTWPVSGVDGPWVSAFPPPFTVLAVRKTWTGTKTITVPLRQTGSTMTATLTAPGGATLLSAGGATVSGSTLTIPPGVQCVPKWEATGGATLTLTKGAPAIVASYAPVFVETPVVPPTPPTITKLIPTVGPDTGGTTVDIIGTDLTGATAVDFGGTAGTGLTVDPSGGLATVTSPAHTAGPAPVTITTPAGASAAKTFTYEAPLPPGPVVVAVIPGAALPGATIQLVGTNLTGATVTMCGDPVAIVSNDGTIITVVVPPGCPDGPTTITVTTPDGETTAGLTVLPASGPTGGPDVIANLVALLAAELGVPVSSRRSPTATKDSDPSVVVRRTGGPSKGVASDNPTVTIEAWAPTTTESFQLLQSARLIVIEAAEQGRAGLRRYEEFAGPADLPDPSTTNPRHTLTASVVTRLE